MLKTEAIAAPVPAVLKREKVWTVVNWVEVQESEPIQTGSKSEEERVVSRNPLGPIDSHCDAPPYSIVAACQQFGFQSPLDVRWCRMPRVLDWRAEGTCTCGQALPQLKECPFVFLSGEKADFLFKQCSRCRTMFWDVDVAYRD